MKPEDYPTTRAIARKLLEMEDVIAVFPTPVFDSPNESAARPVDVKIVKVQGRKCAMFGPLREEPAKVETPEQPK